MEVRTHPAAGCAFAKEVERLCADARVHRLFDWFPYYERAIADFQLAITALPAPSFAEHARAAWLRQRLVARPCTTADSVGNLLAARPGLHASSPSVAVSAHLDTVFPASTQLDVRREQARLLGPGISDNGAGLAALWALAAAFHEVGIVTAAPLLFVANVGEEGEGNLRGMRHLYREHFALGAEATPDEVKEAPPPLALLIALDGAGSENIISKRLAAAALRL